MHCLSIASAKLLVSKKLRRSEQEAAMTGSYDPCHTGWVPRMKVGKTYDS